MNNLESEGKWLGSYDKCDMCNKPIKGVVEWFVDGRTDYGYWALMCPDCYGKYGTGLGIGFGQKYDGKTSELIEGGFKKGEVE